MPRATKDMATHHMAVRAVGVEMVLTTAAVAPLRLRSQGALGGDVVGEFAAVVAAHAASPAIAVGLVGGKGGYQWRVYQWGWCWEDNGSYMRGL